jgi:hypothetical protein
MEGYCNADITPNWNDMRSTADMNKLYEIPLRRPFATNEAIKNGIIERNMDI